MKKKLNFKYLTKFISAIVITTISISCREDMPAGMNPISGLTKITVKDAVPWTKSVLGNDIESKITEIKLASYNSSGVLESVNYSQNEKNLTLELPKWTEHNIYALVNMGDIQVPDNEEDLSKLTYRIPSYKDLSVRGLPMVGSAKGLAPEIAECEIYVDRLVAKIILSLSGGDVVPDEITSVSIAGCNMVLSPFSQDGSKARKTSDISDGEEGQSEILEGWSGKELFFYVPENMQGVLLPGNNDMYAKVPSGLDQNGNSSLPEICSRLEAKVRLKDPLDHHGMAGEILYRFYLGADNTTDFNVKRNTIYNVSLSLSWEGQFIKENWKVDNDNLLDNRTLEVKGISGYSLGGNESSLKESDKIMLTGGKSSFAYVDFGLSGSGDADITATSYEAEKGWKISSSTLEELQKSGIDFKVMTGYLHFEKRTSQLVMLDKEVTDGEQYIILSPQKRFFIEFSKDESTESSTRVIPFSVESFDGRKRATIKIYSANAGSLSTELSGSEHYLGQKPRLTVSGLPEDVSGISFAPSEESKDKITITDSGDNSCLITLRDTGLVTVGIRSVIDGEPFELTSVSFKVKAPILHFDAQEYRIPLDGSLISYKLIYRTESGETMSVAKAEGEAIGTNLSPEMFNGILRPQVWLYDSSEKTINGVTFTCSAKGITIYRTTSANGLQGNLFLPKPLIAKTPLTMIGGKTNHKAIKWTESLVTTIDAFPEFDSNTKIGIIENMIFGGLGAAAEGSQYLTKGSQVTFSNAPRVKVSVSEMSLSIESDALDIDFKTDKNNYLTASFKEEINGYSAGKIPIYAVIKGKYQKESSDRIPIGYVESYLHTLIGGIAIRNSDNDWETVHIQADVAGQNEVGAFNVLRTTLLSRASLITCSVHEGNGWVKLKDSNDLYAMDDVGDHGEALIPNQGDANSHLNIFKVYSGSKGLRQNIFDIIPGDYFLSSFSSWKVFSNRFSPCFSYSLEGVPGLHRSPVNKSVYHCVNSGTGSEKDSNGLSYYVIGTATIDSQWISDDFEK